MEYDIESFSKREDVIRQRLKMGAAEVDPEFLKMVSRFIDEHDGPIYLFGFSPFTNLGDHALWAALMRLIRELGDIRIRGLIARPPMKMGGLDRNSLIIFPGGGSLGNRYTSAKRRVELIEAMRPKAILQMPVSTTFAYPGAVTVDRAANAYNNVDNSLIFVRDTQSQAEAREVLGFDTQLAPDLSALLPSMKGLIEDGRGTLFLLRQDQEAGLASVAPAGCISTDWNQFNKSAPARLKRLERLWWQSGRRWSVYRPLNISPILSARSKLAARIAEDHTVRALALLSGFQRVVTDRLHGMLLAKKLGLPCFAIDNDHKKLSRYADTWLNSDRDSIVFCNSTEEAIKRIDG